jgi:hypothetical protein
MPRNKLVKGKTRHIYIEVTQKQMTQIINYTMLNQIPSNEIDLDTVLKALETETTADTNRKRMPRKKDPDLNISAWVPK